MIQGDFTELRAVMEEFAARFAERYKANLRESGRPASGALENSIRTEVRAGETRYEVVLSLLEYWKYIERGTKPHWPGIENIRQWIRVKPVIPRPFADGRLPTERELAYLISRKIAREGTEGSHDLAWTQEQTITDEFKARCSVALAKAFGNVIIQEFRGERR